MSLLEEIQQAAIDSESDLGGILRKCKVLASDLESKPLEDWLLGELNGYPLTADLPSYRIWPMQLKGDFSLLGGRVIKGLLITESSVPETLRERYMKFFCHDSVSAIEEILRQNQSFFKAGVGDLALALELHENAHCMQAWGEFGRNHLAQVLNSVRNRMLDFVLAVKRETPSAGEINSLKTVGAEKVGHIFNMTIHGDANLLTTNGDIQMGDTYQAGQAGAIGPGAHAHDMTFQQIWNQHGSEIDLATLANELSTLTEALREEASTPEHQLAIGNVAAAEIAASQGDGPKAMQYLRSGGKWALKVAQDIGVEVAAAAIALTFSN